MEIILQILLGFVFIVIGLILIAAFALSLREPDDPLKMQIIARLGLPTKACPDCGKSIPASMRRCSDCKSKAFSDGITAVAGLFGVALGAVVLVGLVRAGFSILQGINLEALNPEFKKAIERAGRDLQALSSGNERLERAKALLAANDKISIDQAAMLTSATLESGLKTLSQRNGVEQNLGETEGMVELAQRLRDRAIVSAGDLSGIKNLVYKVRNPVMHGDFEKFSEADVKEQIEFTSEFLSKHNLR